jgi:hypothetical protein
MDAPDSVDAVLIRTLTCDREHVIIASDPPDSANVEDMQGFAAFLDQAASVGRELAATFPTADGKLAVVLRKRAPIVIAPTAGDLDRLRQ